MRRRVFDSTWTARWWLRRLPQACSMRGWTNLGRTRGLLDLPAWRAPTAITALEILTSCASMTEHYRTTTLLRLRREKCHRVFLLLRAALRMRTRRRSGGFTMDGIARAMFLLR